MLRLSELTRAIQAGGDITDILKEINTQDLSRLNSETFSDYVNNLLEKCYKADAGKYVKPLIKMFCESNADEHAYSVGIMIVCSLASTKEYITWLSNNGLDLLSVIEQAITSDISYESVYGVRMCLEIEQYDLETLFELLEQARTYANNLILLVVEHAIGTHPDREFAPVPAYLSNTLNKTTKELYELLPPPDKEVMTIDELAIASAWNYKITGRIEQFDMVKEETYEHLVNLDEQGVQEFADLYFNTTTTSLYINRVLGPIISFATSKSVDDELEDDDESEHPKEQTYCSMYGGCHMLTCMHFEVVDGDIPEANSIGTYFTGYCRQCLRKIVHERAVVRKPRLTGGFMGCYCSFDCIRESIAQNSYYALNLQNVEGTNGDKAGEETTKIHENNMTDILEDILNRDGIELPLDPENGPRYIDRPRSDNFDYI
jgi:hypothetical protein